MSKYFYHINLNERGSFYADVRNEADETIYEIRAGDELRPDETSIFEDGFMRHTQDINGLANYLTNLGVIAKGDGIYRG